MATVKHQKVFIETVKKALQFQKNSPVRAEQELRSLPATWQVAFNMNEKVGNGSRLKTMLGVIMLGREAFN